MNVKCNSNELYCLLGDDYERIYSTLKRNLNLNVDVFAERSVGYGYLQWCLPGDGWQQLAQCDPMRRAEIEGKVAAIREQIAKKFGANADMAQRVLSTPDDNRFIYYRDDSFGRTAICFAAWGYKRPEQVSTAGISVATAPKGATERVTITIVRDGQPQPSYPFELNGYQRRTGPGGSFFIGHVEVGQKFSIAVDGVMSEHTVNAGDGDIKIYLASEAVPVDDPAVVSPVTFEPAVSPEKPVTAVDEPEKRVVETPLRKRKFDFITMLCVLCFILLVIGSYVAGYLLL